MSLMTECHAFYDGRAIAFSCIIHSFFHCFIYHNGVISIYGFTGNVISFCTYSNGVCIGYTMDIYGYAVIIIFAKEYNGQFPCRCHVYSFVECTLVGCAVTKETQCHMFITINLGCQCGTSCNGNAGTNDTICAQAVQTSYIRNMHGTAFTFAVTCFFAEQFCQHFIQRSTFCDAMSMSSMGRCHVVISFQGHAGTCCNCFLTDAQVDVPCQHPFCKAFRCFCFKSTNTQHCLIHAHQHFLRIFFRTHVFFTPFLFSSL